MKKKLNGYYLACRLLMLLLSGDYPGNGFKDLCQSFGPSGWDRLTDQDKIELKQLAARYRKSNAWQYEKTRSGHLDSDSFLNAVFVSQNECDYFCAMLNPAYNYLSI